MNRNYRWAALGWFVLNGCASDVEASRYSPPNTQNDAGGVGGGKIDGAGGGAEIDQGNVNPTPEPSPEASTEDSANPIADAAPETGRSSCEVKFTVKGIQWSVPEGGDAADASMHAVYLVGDDASLGAWTPASGFALTEGAPGAWAGALSLRDHLRIEFKFVKMVPGADPEWEGFGAFDSNRSLRVDCASDGGEPSLPDVATSSDDAGYGEAGPFVSMPAVGKSYSGTFNVRPPDATK